VEAKTEQHSSVSKLTNRIFITLIVITSTMGNLLLGVGMQRMPDFGAVSFFSYLGALSTNWYFLGGTGLLIVWMISQLWMFTWADLTYVLPVTASAYIFTAILSKFFLGERISIARWTGIAIISFGVLLVSETPPDTKHQPERTL
jgi:drug/metabolite transporter (DMT)-like permease